MREAKFRGKRIDTGEWVYGYYMRRYQILEGKVCDVIVHEQKGNDGGMYIVESETVGEFTGQLEKKGVEVYEDDLVKDRLGRIGHVLFENGSYHLRNIHGTFLLSSFASEGEVIGNRHDTPELLERSGDAQ